MEEQQVNQKGDAIKERGTGKRCVHMTGQL